MRTTLSRSLALLLALMSAPALPAESVQQQMRRVETALARIAQEQQSIYQQFNMVQELRRNDERQILPALQSYTPPGAPPNYDDVRRQEDARAQRVRELQSELDRLYSRYRELEEQKKPLLETLSALAQQRGEEPLQQQQGGTP